MQSFSESSTTSARSGVAMLFLECRWIGLAVARERRGDVRVSVDARAAIQICQDGLQEGVGELYQAVLEAEQQSRGMFEVPSKIGII